MSAHGAAEVLSNLDTSDLPVFDPSDWTDIAIVSSAPNPNPIEYSPPQNSPDGFDPSTMIDLASFGAVGDGSDATAAIQRAEFYADSQGKSLFFDAGSYEVDQVLRVSQNERWVAKAGSVVLQAAPGLNTMLGIVGAPAYNGQPVSPIDGVSFNGLTFDGAVSGTGVHSPLVVAWIADGLSFSNCTFEHVNGIGVLLSNVVGTVVSGCAFSDIGNAPQSTGQLGDASQGIAFCSNETQQPNHNAVEGCTFTGIGLDAISASDQNNFKVENNVMFGLNVLSGWNQWPQAAAGVYLVQDAGATIANNSIQGASGNGIDVIHVSDLAIVGNAVIGSGEAGIAICDVTDAKLTNNVSLNNNQLADHFPHTGGITIAGDAEDPSSGIVISGNTSSDTQSTPTQDWGLQIDAGTVVSNLTVDPSNSFTGNVRGAENFVPTPASPTSSPRQSDSATSTQCFHTSARLLTTKGEKQVSKLKVGDVLVLGMAPWSSPITRIIKQSVNVLDHRSPGDVMPVRVVKNAFGKGRPNTDLILSPDHSIYTQGYLVPVKCLVNGATILPCSFQAFDYWHVELPRHNVVLAQGLAVESFLDLDRLAGARDGSASGAERAERMARTWDRHACAPQLREGRQLEAIRHQIWEFARADGWRQSGDPHLALVADGETLTAETTGDELVWMLAGRFNRATLFSAVSRPSDASSQLGGDGRLLGVAVTDLCYDGVSQYLCGLTRAEGWHDAEPGWRWTTGRTQLSLQGVNRLSIRVKPWNTYLVKHSTGGRISRIRQTPLSRKDRSITHLSYSSSDMSRGKEAAAP